MLGLFNLTVPKTCGIGLPALAVGAPTSSSVDSLCCGALGRRSTVTTRTNKKKINIRKH
jgi:hypothetical protein